MKLFELTFVEITIVICLLIGVLLLVSTSIIEALHLNDKGWEKPKTVRTLESTGIGFVGIAFFVIICYTIIFAILNT
jgi:high-affinity nickel permease